VLIAGIYAPPAFAQTTKQLGQMGIQVPGGGSSAPPPDVFSCSWWSHGFACGAYRILDSLSDFVTSYFVRLAAYIFDTFLRFALLDISQTTIVKVGSSIAVATANLFFILILLWIAIATIFDWADYSARQLLPKLIIIALLINFSVAIGATIINLSNGIARTFYCVIAGTSTLCPANPGGDSKSISENFADISKFRSVAVITREDLPPPQGTPTSSENELKGAFIAIFAKMLLAPVLIFTLLAGAFFILARQIALMFVLILSPLAFFFYILPGTRGMNSRWWSALFKWSFFLPAYLFFIMLTIKTGGAMLTAIQANPNDPASGTFTLWMQYLVLIGLMIGSLIVSNQLSIYGAGAVTNLGKRWSKGAGKRVGWKVGSLAARGALRTPGVRQAVGRTPGLKYAAALAIQKDAAYAKKRADFYAKLPDAQLARMLHTMNPGIRQQVWNSLKESRRQTLRGIAPDLDQYVTSPTFGQRIRSSILGQPATPAQQAAQRALQERNNRIVAAAITHLPQNIRTAVEAGMREAMQSLPENVTVAQAVGAAEASALEAARRAFPDSPEVEERIREEFRRQQDAIRASVETAMHPERPARNEAIYTQVAPLIMQHPAIQNLPNDVRISVSLAVERSIRALPANATPEMAAAAIEQAVQSAVAAQPPALRQAGEDAVRATREQMDRIRQAINTALRTFQESQRARSTTPRPRQAPADYVAAYEERIEDLESRLGGLEERQEGAS